MIFHRLIYHPQAISQTQNRLLNEAEDAGDICHCLHTVIHDMIATPQRPGRFPINLQSHGGGQTATKTRLEASHRLFRPLFFLPSEASEPSIIFFFFFLEMIFPSLSLTSCRVMFIKRKSIFKALPAPQIDWEHVWKGETLPFQPVTARPSRADLCKSGLFLAGCFTFRRKVQPLVQKFVIW